MKRDKTQYAEAVAGTGTDKFDVVLTSFGGNDLNFDTVMMDCIGIDEAIAGAAVGGRAGGWAGAAVGAVAGKVSGRCRAGLDAELRASIDEIAGPNLSRLYDQLAEATNEGALIVVAGYPQLFEDPTTSWAQANAFTRRCHGMYFDDANMLRGLAGRFNQVIGTEVNAAAKRHPDRNWIFADVALPFDGHGLCSDRGDQWINGLTTGLTDGSLRLKRSFHPTQKGHTDGYAAFISGIKQVNEWRPQPAGDISRDQVLNMTLPPVHSCDYADAFNVPATLTNGELYGPRGGGMFISNVILTDVDGDGVLDGIAQLVCSSGAAGTSTGIFILDGESGTTSELPYTEDAAIRSPELSVYRVEEMTLMDRNLILSGYGHGPGDSTCCPSYDITLRYRVGNTETPELMEFQTTIR